MESGQKRILQEDEKSGAWKYNVYYDEGEIYTTVISYKGGVEQGKTTTTSSTRGLLWEANYTNGKFSGPVMKYFPGNPDLEQCKMNYDNNEFSGDYTWSDRDGHEITGTYFNNRISSCFVSDSTGKQLYSIEQIVLLSGTKYSGLYTIETDSGSVGQQIIFDIGVSYDSIMPFVFLWNFEYERDNLRLTHTGNYTLVRNGYLLVSGRKENGIKIGTWEYKYNPEVTWKVTYKNGAILDEYFYTSSGAFSGKYVALFSWRNESVEFKIDESLRDGKSEYKRNGKVYRKEKYKKGVLRQ
jgi:antitoxin component YwqK of YwqJK toxin-antitoxin module